PAVEVDHPGVELPRARIGLAHEHVLDVQVGVVEAGVVEPAHRLARGRERPPPRTEVALAEHGPEIARALDLARRERVAKARPRAPRDGRERLDDGRAALSSRGV